MNIQKTYKGPLNGLKVLDFGHYYAGPMAAMLLADQGATVIRIVKPGKPELREQPYRLLNRNKKLLSLNLKTDEDKTKALALIEQADVVIENFRPGVMKRLGMDYASVKGRNPGLIYLSLPGFASTDKERAHIQAWEGVLDAAAGFYNQSSRIREALQFPPIYTWVPLCSVHGSMHGATAIMAALIAKQKSGAGFVLEVPLVEAGISAVSAALLHIDPKTVGTIADKKDLPDEYKPYLYAAEDKPEKQLEKIQQAYETLMPSPFYVLPHTCADGRKLVICCPGHSKHIDILLKALGLDKQLKKEGFVNEGAWVTGLDNNLSGTMSEERTERLKALVKEKLFTKTALEWETILAEAGFPATMVRTRDEWFDLPVMMESGVFIEMNDGRSVLRVPGRVASVDKPTDTDPLDRGCDDNLYQEAEAIDWQQAVCFFESTELTEEQNNTIDSVPSRVKGDMLKGLKVLDFSSVLAGPTASYTLAQYGAEVIRLEPPGEGPGLLSHKLELMQGKRSMLIDMSTASGREVLNKLIAWCDVVLHNSLDDVAKRMGISHDQVKAINPAAVSCQISAFGGVHRGGWENRPGYDCLAQSASGIMVSFGSMDRPEDHGAITCGDMTAGEGGAFTALLAVYQRCKTGYAGEGRISLAQAMNFSQLPYMISEQGNSDWGEPHGQFAVGPSWYQRLYACRDGWVYVGTAEESKQRLSKLVSGQPSASVKDLEVAFAKQDCQYWMTQLRKNDIACVQPVMPVDVRGQSIRRVDNQAADETVKDFLDILYRENHPGGLKVVFAGPTWVRVGENYSYKRLHAAPKLGEHTVEILKELGYSNPSIEEMLRLNIAHEFMPAIGNKEALLFQP